MPNIVRIKRRDVVAACLSDASIARCSHSGIPLVDNPHSFIDFRCSLGDF